MRSPARQAASVPPKALKLLIPIALLGLLLFAAFNGPPEQASPDGSHEEPAGQAGHDPSRHLIRPFQVQGNQVALALDGGKLPVPGGQVPSIVIGGNVLRMLHLCWPHDWTDSGFRTSFKNLQDLYASEEGASLPALKIHLNPVFSDPAGEALHRAMLQVYFRNETRETYFTLANGMCDGSLAPDAEAVRKRVEEIDPILIADWDTRLDWLENDMEKTFSIARVQQARNAAIVGQDHATRLTSMHATLPPFANPQEIAAFVQEANASQFAWLQSQPAPAP